MDYIVTSSWKTRKVIHEVLSFGKYECGQHKYGFKIHLIGEDKNGAIITKDRSYRNRLVSKLNSVNVDLSLDELVRISLKLKQKADVVLIKDKEKQVKFGVRLKGFDNSVIFYTESPYKAKKIRTLLKAWQNKISLKKLISFAEMIDN